MDQVGVENYLTPNLTHGFLYGCGGPCLRS